MKKKNRIKKRNFSLIEIIIVIVIMLMLASVAVPLYMKNLSKARVSTAKTQIKLVEQALMDFKLDVGAYPDSSEGLEALTTNVGQNEKWDGPYIKPAVPKDPWGNDYVYTVPSEHGNDFDLSSYGADGQPGGEGENADIGNWE